MSINHQELVQPIEDPAGNLIGIFVPYITRINSKNAVGRLITNAPRSWLELTLKL